MPSMPLTYYPSLFLKWTTRKQGTFEVFHNEDDQDEKSATNPIFEAGVPDNVYEDMDKVLGETKIHANPPYQ